MTTEIVHGNPGAYKSASLVHRYGIPALKAGRTVITNIRGFNSLERVEDAFDIVLPPECDLISVPFDIDGFEKMARWFHWVPDGSVILMDEGQRVYPTRLKTLSDFDLLSDDPSKPKTVEEAFDTHRHRNLDIYISTTNIAKIHKEVRQVSEFSYRHKNLKGLLPFLDGRYKRVKHDPENSGKSPSHYMGSTIEKIDKRVFNCYESTATGKAKDTESSFSLLSQPKFLVMLAIIAYCLYSLSGNYLEYGSFLPRGTSASQSPSVQPVQATVKSHSAKAPNVSHGDVRVRSVDQTSAVSDLIQSITHSSATLRVNHLNYVWFESHYGRVTDRDLKALGVTVTRLAGAFYLSYGSDQKLVRVGYEHDYVEQPEESAQL